MLDSFPVLDTHTGGEITRIVLAADIGLADLSIDRQLESLKNEFDWIRRSLTCEPRGSAFAVGAVVTANPDGVSKIVFFNNVGYLGMCGHGLIGVVEALRYLGLIQSGTFEFDTPAGRVNATLQADSSVRFVGVRSYCHQRDVTVVLGGEQITGDVAYGGNWFFLAPLNIGEHTRWNQLLDRAQELRAALTADGITGADGAEIDHIEFYEPLRNELGCRNFVLCPGGHFDRSPCGTGTSAKLACLVARDQLSPGQQWIQQSITGSRFIASYQHDGEGIRAAISGRAHVIAETKQIFDATDALRFGLVEQH